MDWQFHPDTQHWEVTSGAWRAIVAQLHANEWYPYVQRIEPPQERYDGPPCEAALEGRMWCQSQIAALAGPARRR
jgi:hypothetical protein